MSRIKLKPCPFCGSIPHFHGSDEDDGGNFINSYIFCSNCALEMIGPEKELKYDNKGRLIGGWLTEEELQTYDNELIERWNTRKEQENERSRDI